MKRGFLSEIVRREQAGERKSASRQLLECGLLYLRSGLGPGFYHLARLDETGVPLRDVLGFASVREYNAAVHRANDASYHRVSQHKAMEKAVLTTYGIPTPELLAYADKTRGRDRQGRPIRCAEDLVRLLSVEADGSKLCLKQANGWGGEGFRGIAVHDSGRQLVDLPGPGTQAALPYFEECFAGSPEGFVVERYVEQAPFYAELNPSSVNSYRILIWDRAGSHRPWILAFLRAGRHGRLVDNASAGAIILPVNPETGCLAPGFQKYGDGSRFSVHPDSQQQLEGVKPPDFEDAVDAALAAVRAFPGISFAGVDVAMSNDGPLILELNVWPDYAGFAYCREPSREAFTRYA